MFQAVENYTWTRFNFRPGLTFCAYGPMCTTPPKMTISWSEKCMVCRGKKYDLYYVLLSKRNAYTEKQIKSNYLVERSIALHYSKYILSYNYFKRITDEKRM